MTDPFEEALRDAVRGLPSASGDLPTYHDAWHRGRRRRIIKRSALAAAGALVFIAALTVNLGRFPGSESTDVDDVATGFEQATAVVEPTPLATTSPLAAPDEQADGGAAGAAAAPSIVIPTPTDATADPTPVPTVVNTPAPAETVTEQPAPTSVPEPTAAPTAAPAATAAPTVDPVPTAQPDVSPTPDPTATSTLASDEQIPSDAASDQAAGTAEQPADPGSPDAPTPDPAPAFAATTSTADATILGGAARGTPLACDLDGDGVADASCELLVDYACTGDGDVRAGYSAIDTNGDEALDTCVAADITQCDTTSDGVGDTPCIIELNPEPDPDPETNPDDQG